MCFARGAPGPSIVHLREKPYFCNRLRTPPHILPWPPRPSSCTQTPGSRFRTKTNTKKVTGDHKSGGGGHWDKNTIFGGLHILFFGRRGFLYWEKNTFPSVVEHLSFSNFTTLNTDNKPKKKNNTAIGMVKKVDGKLKTDRERDI